MPPQVPVIRQVEPQSEREIGIHEINSDLEGDTGNPTYPINIYTSKTSSVLDSHFSGDLFHALFLQSSFSHVDLKPILDDTSRDPLVSSELPNDTPPPSPHVSTIRHTSQNLTTSSCIPFFQVETPSISTIPSSQTKTPIPTSSTFLVSIFLTSTLDISPLDVEIPVSQSEPQSSTSTQKEALSTTEDMEDFGEDAVVSLGKYFWSKKDKAILKKGSKRTREGTLKHVSTFDQIVWRIDAPNEKEGALDIAAAMGAFAGDNYNSVSQLTKDLLSKEHEIHKEIKDLEAAEAFHLKDIELLKQEHQDK